MTITKRSARAAADPRHACEQCGTFHSDPCSAVRLRRLGAALTRMAAEADALVPEGRRARRTLQEMAPGFERQPVLTLYRPVMVGDSCPLCGRWSCNGSDCPPAVASALASAVSVSPPTCPA